MKYFECGNGSLCKMVLFQIRFTLLVQIINGRTHRSVNLVQPAQADYHWVQARERDQHERAGEGDRHWNRNGVGLTGAIGATGGRDWLEDGVDVIWTWIDHIILYRIKQAVLYRINPLFCTGSITLFCTGSNTSRFTGQTLHALQGYTRYSVLDQSIHASRDCKHRVSKDRLPRY